MGDGAVEGQAVQGGGWTDHFGNEAHPRESRWAGDLRMQPIGQMFLSPDSCGFHCLLSAVCRALSGAYIHARVG